MIATYNDMSDFTLSVRSISVKKELQLETHQAEIALAAFPMSTESWGQQSGVITVGGKPRVFFVLTRVIGRTSEPLLDVSLI